MFISFCCKSDFENACGIISDFYYGIDYDNYILEFDKEKERDLFLGLLLEKDIEDTDIFESETPSYL